MKGMKTGGRKAGTPNKATGHIREIAQAHGADAVALLRKVMDDDTAPPAVRVSAANALLDRGYGKPTDRIEHADVTEQLPNIFISFTDGKSMPLEEAMRPERERCELLK